MFDKLIDVVINFIDLFYFVRVVDAWERGIVLRLGQVHRNVRPGLVFHLPFGIERVVCEDVNDRVADNMPTQSLTTADGVGVVLTPLVVYAVKNVKRLVLRAGGKEEAVVDSVCGVISDHVARVNWADLHTEEFQQTVLSAANERASYWGVAIRAVAFKDLVKTRSLRIFNESRHA